eukprot:SAG11_NODE_3389_length_2479_cov_1.614286_3_plen_160_part_00
MDNNKTARTRQIADKMVGDRVYIIKKCSDVNFSLVRIIGTDTPFPSSGATKTTVDPSQHGHSCTKATPTQRDNATIGIVPPSTDVSTTVTHDKPTYTTQEVDGVEILVYSDSADGCPAHLNRAQKDAEAVRMSREPKGQRGLSHREYRRAILTKRHKQR